MAYQFDCQNIYEIRTCTQGIKCPLISLIKHCRREFNFGNCSCVNMCEIDKILTLIKTLIQVRSEKTAHQLLTMSGVYIHILMNV